MARRGWIIRGAIVCAMVALAWSGVAYEALPAGVTGGAFVARIQLRGPIGPAAAEYADSAIRQATRDGAKAIVLQMDTPGGLLESMRDIVAAILASPVPVIGYVAPPGARAASAGTYILYACPLAAMAPGTHLGAATPVDLSGNGPASTRSVQGGGHERANTETRKVLNDAMATIRSLAQWHGRNAAWAEQAVSGAATLTASEAAAQHVVDFMAMTTGDLLSQADGRTVRVNGGTVTLAVRGLPLREYLPNWRARFLGIMTDPTIAYVLLLAGIYGLVLEAFHPGSFFPGVTGSICLLMGLYAMHLLPVNYAGLMLMALGVALLLAEVFLPTAGVLGIGGVIAFVLGSVMLYRRDVPGYDVDIGVIAGIGFCAVVLLIVLLRLLLRVRHARKVQDDKHMLQDTGELLETVAAGGESWAQIGGERWRVCSDETLPAGARVRVIARQGLRLRVAAERMSEGDSP